MSKNVTLGMKKTAGISKYNLKWQLVRAAIKGNKVKFDDKIELVLDYLGEEESLQAWERVYNYLEGLERGYKSSSDEYKMDVIRGILSQLKTAKENLELKIEEEDDWGCFSDEEVKKIGIKLYKDLFLRSKKWLEGGYIHKEQEAFIDKLHGSLIKAGVDYFGENYKIDALREMRHNASKLKNKHKFFF